MCTATAPMLVSPATRSGPGADLVDGQPRQARLHRAVVAVAQVAQEVAAQRGAGKELGVHAGPRGSRTSARRPDPARAPPASGRRLASVLLRSAVCCAWAGSARYSAATSRCGNSRCWWAWKSRSLATIAVTGACIIFGTLPACSAARSRSLPSAVRTNTTRIGRLLVAVGPVSASATTSRSKASATGRLSQALCERALRNSRSRASSDSRCRSLRPSATSAMVVAARAAHAVAPSASRWKSKTTSKKGAATGWARRHSLSSWRSKWATSERRTPNTASPSM